MADVFETSRVVLRCTVVRGQSSSNKATFKVMRGGTQFLTQDVALTGDNAYLTIEKLDVVKPAEANWELTYTVTCDGTDYNGSETTTVWPLKLKLKAVDDKAAAVKGAKFAITQKGEVRFAQTRTDGTIVHFLRWPAAYTLDVVDSFWLVKWNKETERDLVAEVDDRVIPAFESPDQPKDKKQYVNLDSATNGADGSGHTIVFKVYAKDPAGGSGKGGKATNKVWVEVTFGRESTRNSPLPAVTGLTNMTTVTATKKFTGYVPLPSDAGTATFTVELGLAGGDTCTVSLGGTPKCGEVKREFVNWRKIYYEIMAPDFMALEDNGGKKDLPANARTHITNRVKDACFEYELLATHVFTEAEAPAGTVFDSAYFGAAAGTKTYLLTDFTFKSYPKAFVRTKAPRQICLKLCNKNFFFDTGGPTPNFFKDATALTVDLPMPAGYFFVKSAHSGGGDAVKYVRWAAKITVATYFKFPTLEWKDAANATTAGAVNGHVIIHEMLQDQKLDLTFEKPMIGHIKTKLSDTEQAKIQPFIDGLLTDADTLRGNGNKLKFEIIAESGNDRRSSRFTLVKGCVDNAFTGSGNRRQISIHPAVTDAGVARSGTLPITAATGVNQQTVRVTLPNAVPIDPGNLVGPAVTATKCPITVEVQVEQASEGLGLAGQGAQTGENLVFFNTAAMESSIDVLLHELSHSLGLTMPGAWPPGFTARPDVYSGGKIYRDRDHSGWHCAEGVSPAICADPTISLAGKSGNCVMFGENNGDGPTTATGGFCADCKKHLGAADMRRIG